MIVRRAVTILFLSQGITATGYRISHEPDTRNFATQTQLPSSFESLRGSTRPEPNRPPRPPSSRRTSLNGTDSGAHTVSRRGRKVKQKSRPIPPQNRTPRPPVAYKTTGECDLSRRPGRRESSSIPDTEDRFVAEIRRPPTERRNPPSRVLRPTETRTSPPPPGPRRWRSTSGGKLPV